MIMNNYKVIRKEEHDLGNKQLLYLVKELVKKGKAEKISFIITINNDVFCEICAEPTKKDITFFRTFWNDRKSVIIALYDSLDKMKGYISFTVTIKDNRFEEFILEELRMGVKTLYKHPKSEEVVQYSIV